jgi:hypothetical protein
LYVVTAPAVTERRSEPPRATEASDARAMATGRRRDPYFFTFRTDRRLIVAILQNSSFN